MKKNLIKYLAEIKNLDEQSVLKLDESIVNYVKYNTDNRIFSFVYPVNGAKKLSILCYNCNIGEIARYFAKENNVFCYEHNEELKSFAKYVNEREEIDVKWITNDKALKNNDYNIVVYEGGLENLELLKEVVKLLRRDSWILLSGITESKEFADIMVENNLRTYFFHITNYEKIILLRKV